MVYAKLKIRQLQSALGGGLGGADQGGLSNSMMGGGLGVAAQATSAGHITDELYQIVDEQSLTYNG